MKNMVIFRHLQDVRHLQGDVNFSVDVSPMKSMVWDMSEMFTPKGGARNRRASP